MTPPAERPSAPPFDALVLAGRRARAPTPTAGRAAADARTDPVAERLGVSCKALAPAGGVPLVAHVLRELGEAGVRRVVVSVDEPDALAAVAEVRRLEQAGRLLLQPSAASPSRSVEEALAHLGGDAPVLLTTADHPLLTAAVLSRFVTAARARRADVAVGVVAEEVVRAGLPPTRRTWIPLRGGRVTGANLFLLRGPAALRAVAFWRRVEEARKRPWRLAAAFGPRVLLGFALRRLDLEAAFERASDVIGARVAPVALPFAECALDVDRPEDLAAVERVLAARARAAATADARAGQR